MLNYDNLNDMEFEALCNDIMSRKLGIPLRRFGPGRDGGVDLTNDAATKNIVVQVKHYRSSTPEQLIRSLKKELPKVQSLAPQQYYICCSRKLSVENISELYHHFEDYMDSSWNIVTLNEIDDFLKNTANRDILEKHFKLWLDDVGILEDIFGNELFVDCEVLLDDIEQQQKFFVQTKAFDQALHVLENHQVLCIVGNPGVGKSITSKMLVLRYAASGYQVRYTSDVTDIGSLKRSISQDPNKKEIILLDDCFGQAYFEMRSEQSNALVELIKYSKRRPNKVLILNSRVTIFQEAQHRQQNLAQSLDRDDFKVFLLDINNLSDIEKAKIFYNHLAFSRIPDEYLANIRMGQRYRNIVSHQNYNPRIIEFVCSPKRYRNVTPQHFCDFIIKHLDNPTEMWADEYENKLKRPDRILLQTIYSLTNTSIREALVRQCFERRISGDPIIDKSLEPFNESLSRLSEGFIKILDNHDTKELSMCNPSVNDFIRNRLDKNNSEKEELLNSICCFNQLRLLEKEERIPYIANLLQTNQIDQFIFLSPENKTYAIAHCILASGLCIERYRLNVQEYVMKHEYAYSLYDAVLPGGLKIFDYLLIPSIWKTYCMADYFTMSDNLYNFMCGLDPKTGLLLLGRINHLFEGNSRESFIVQADKYLASIKSQLCTVYAPLYEGLVIGTTVYCASCYNSETRDWALLSAFDKAIREIAYQALQKDLSALPKELKNFCNSITPHSIVVEVPSFWWDDPVSVFSDHFESDNYTSYDNKYSDIDGIFER